MKFKKYKGWKVKFYLNGQYVCSTRVHDIDTVFDDTYVVTIWFKRQFFKSIFVRTVIRADKLLYKDVIKNELHVGAYLFEGVKA